MKTKLSTRRLSKIKFCFACLGVTTPFINAFVVYFLNWTHKPLALITLLLTYFILIHSVLYIIGRKYN